MSAQIGESVKLLAEVVFFRIGPGEIYLKIVEVPTQFFTEERRKRLELKLPSNKMLIEENDCIDIDLSAKNRAKDHWSHRVKDGGEYKIMITQDDLREFLKITKSTFGVFRFCASDPMIERYTLVYLSI
jgi:hypothetical protein